MPAYLVFASLMAAALLAGGCVTVPPNLEEPEARFADAWQNAGSPGIETGTSDNAAWWKSFNDSVLDTLIVEAHASNLDLQIAGLRVVEAGAILGSKTIDANLDGAIAAYDDALVSLTGDVATRYVSLRTLQEQLAFVESNVALQKLSLGLVQERVPTSARTELDIQQAQALLNRTRANIPRLEHDIRQTMNALSVLLARPPGELNAILGGVGAIPTGPDRIEIGLPHDLLRLRPDVREAALAATTQSAPTIVTRRKKSLRVQDALLQQRIASYQLTVLRAAQEVEDALTGYLKSREEVAFRESTVTASQRAADLALDQYRNGAVRYEIVLDTQRLLSRDQNQLTQARGHVAHNLISAYRAMGAGWQLRNDQPFVGEDVKSQMRARTDWGELLDP
jgi:outer membrane protein TolC